MASIIIIMYSFNLQILPYNKHGISIMEDYSLYVKVIRKNHGSILIDIKKIAECTILQCHNIILIWKA